MNEFKNPKVKFFAIDFDGTIATLEPNWKIGTPIQKTLDIMKSICKKGGYCVIFTARTSEQAPEIESWLVRHSVCHQGVNYGRKPSASCYIDDRAVNIKDLWKTPFLK